MRLQVGMYVRTKDGVIAKCDEIIKNFDISFDREVFKAFDNDTPDVIEIPWIFKNEYIKKYSFDIIDLIEVGDYVNGYMVMNIIEADICGDEKLTDRKIIIEDSSYIAYGRTLLSNNDINYVVTKEQFDSMKYVIERSN